MKKAAIIVVLIFALGIIMSSCNKEACPAYSQIDTDPSEQVG